MSEMADAIRALSAEKGISEDSIRQTIENMIKAAYRKTYPAAGDNCVVEFADDMSDVTVYAMKTVVDGVYDPATEIELEEARKVADDAAVGDTMKVLVDPKNFVRASVSVGKQNAHQALNESFKDNLYNEYRDKVGQVIIGYYQRERNGNIYVDLGKVEGVLPQKYQAPHESYEKNERIRSYVKEIRKNSTGIQLILSRTDPEFVKRIIEVEVSEVSDGIVSIYKVVREAGYRTKIAVTSTKADVDPVGACVGLKGMRIQNVIRELGGEKIDILRYDDDPHVFIKNALSPAEVKRVVILDAEKKEALAIVDESQFSVAIGKQGQNVRLANRLCDWSIDVKTEEQAAEMDLTETDTRKAAEQLFGGAQESAPEEEYEEISTIVQLPGVDKAVAEKLAAAGIEDIEQFMAAYDDGSASKVEGVSAEEIEEINRIINENVEFVDEYEDNADSADGDGAEPDESSSGGEQ